MFVKGASVVSSNWFLLFTLYSLCHSTWKYATIYKKKFRVGCMYFAQLKSYNHYIFIKLLYLPDMCIVHTFFSEILPLKSRCALYMEPFVFKWGDLHIIATQKIQSLTTHNFMKQGEINQNKTFVNYISNVSVHIHQWHETISH